MHRRTFLKTSVAAASVLLAPSLDAETGTPGEYRVAGDVRFPEKRPLIVHSDRPPLLETPREVFARPLTPNDAFFVRWHTPKFPLAIDLEDYRINVHGLVDKRLYLTIDDLKTKFEPVEITATLQCGGNSRSAFKPTTSGIQWGNGAVGCARWKGARLRDVLAEAGPTPEARYLHFNGRDKAVIDKAPRLIRELKLDEINDEIIIAYEMNGEPLPLLNGYPVRLVIPGWYSDSWVKMLSDITVTAKHTPLYYMDVAYRVPDNECECETPDAPAPKTKPITEMNVKSLIGKPRIGTQVRTGIPVEIEGIAFDGGHGIKAVRISVDGGKSWQEATLGKAESPYAFRPFRFSFVPEQKGKLILMSQAVNTAGEMQPMPEAVRWNHGGYKYNGVDRIAIDVV